MNLVDQRAFKVRSTWRIDDSIESLLRVATKQKKKKGRCLVVSSAELCNPCDVLQIKFAVLTSSEVSPLRKGRVERTRVQQSISTHGDCLLKQFRYSHHDLNSILLAPFGKISILHALNPVRSHEATSISTLIIYSSKSVKLHMR